MWKLDYAKLITDGLQNNHEALNNSKLRNGDRSRHMTDGSNCPATSWRSVVIVMAAHGPWLPVLNTTFVKMSGSYQ